MKKSFVQLTMPLTLREQWKEAMFRDYPNLRMIPHAVDGLIDMYLRDTKAFKKQNKKWMEEFGEDTPETKPRKDPVIFYGISKGDEIEEVALPDSAKPASDDGFSVEVQYSDP